MDGGRKSSGGMELLSTTGNWRSFTLWARASILVKLRSKFAWGETTVDTYRARIKDKLQLRNAAELYSRAAQWVQEQGA